MLFEFLRGTLVKLTPEKAVLDVGGIGYLLHIPLHLFTKGVKIDEEILFFISHVVREDSERLYGFLDFHERDLFERLSDVSGIGPKSALSLIGHLGYNELSHAIQTSDISLLCRVPGIGKKTSERLCLELRDKLKPPGEPKVFFEPQASSKKVDAIAALIHLGYSNPEAKRAVEKTLEKVEEESTPLSELITRALRS